MSDLVCPDCGGEEFTQRRVALIEYTVRVSESGCDYDVSEEVADGGDRDEPLQCDCGAEYHDTSELVTADAYNESEEAWPLTGNIARLAAQ